MNGRTWTAEDDRILSERYPVEGRSPALAAQLGRTLAAMSERARLIGVTCVLSLVDRFWSYVDKNGPIIRPELGPCWVWTAFRHKRGYGKIMIDGKPVSAHRLAWKLETGNEPGDIDILHRCDNPPCVRFAHLFDGTAADNLADMVAKRRQCKGSVFRPAKIPGAARPGDHRTVLTARLVIEVCARYRRGESLRVLAEEIGTHKNTIWQAVTGRTWKHVDLPSEVSVG